MHETGKRRDDVFGVDRGGEGEGERLQTGARSEDGEDVRYIRGGFGSDGERSDVQAVQRRDMACKGHQRGGGGEDDAGKDRGETERAGGGGGGGEGEDVMLREEADDGEVELGGEGVPGHAGGEGGGLGCGRICTHLCHEALTPALARPPPHVDENRTRLGIRRLSVRRGPLSAPLIPATVHAVSHDLDLISAFIPFCPAVATVMNHCGPYLDNTAHTFLMRLSPVADQILFDRSFRIGPLHSDTLSNHPLCCACRQRSCRYPINEITESSRASIASSTADGTHTHSTQQREVTNMCFIPHVSCLARRCRRLCILGRCHSRVHLFPIFPPDAWGRRPVAAPLA